MTSLKILKIKNSFYIFFSALLLLLSLCLINYSNIDLIIQNYLFNFESKTWFIDRNEPLKKLLFYDFPKTLFGLTIFFLLIGSVIGFTKNKAFGANFFTKNRHKFLLILTGFILIPLIAANVKKFTNIYCPNQLRIYEGNFPYVKIFESYPENFQQKKKGACFPAGHAVVGFALFILFFAFTKKSYKILAFLSASFLGWLFGFYQMAKGVHFFGDTLIAMLLCFLLAALISSCFNSYLAKSQINLLKQ
jgi:membrane-associated PAP2 superfamily phosphatase